jgi:hypothetical protein
VAQAQQHGAEIAGLEAGLTRDFGQRVAGLALERELDRERGKPAFARGFLQLVEFGAGVEEVLEELSPGGLLGLVVGADEQLGVVQAVGFSSFGLRCDGKPPPRLY